MSEPLDERNDQPMQCAILSGGLGTRLGELGRRHPKHLVDVLGRPFAHRQLEWLAAQGVSDVVECIGHLGDEIVSSLADGGRFGLSVTYSRDPDATDGSTRPGTGGALILAHRRGLLAPRFLVLYGDSWLRLDINELWRHAEAHADDYLPATMAVIDNRHGSEPSNATIDGPLVRYRKPRGEVGASAGATHIDYGISVLSSSLLDVDGPAQGDLAHMMETWSAAGRVAAHEATRPYDEVGTPEGVARLEAALLAPGRPG